MAENFPFDPPKRPWRPGDQTRVVVIDGHPRPDPYLYAYKTALPAITKGEIVEGVKEQYKRELSTLSDRNTVRPLPTEVYDELIPEDGGFEAEDTIPYLYLYGTFIMYGYTWAQIWSIHARSLVSFVYQRAKQAALFTIGIPVGPAIHPGPHPYIYWKLMKRITKSRWKIWWPTNYMSYVCRIPAIWIGAEIGQDLFPWSPDAAYWGALFGWAALPPSIFGVRPFMFPYGIKGALRYPGAFLALTAFLVGPSLREFRYQNLEPPKWWTGLQEAVSGFSMRRWIEQRTGGKWQEMKNAFAENRGWELRWQALENDMIMRYQREHNVVKKLETDEFNALEERRVKLGREKLLLNIVNSQDVVNDDYHRAQLRQLAQKEIQARKERIAKWLPFVPMVQSWFSSSTDSVAPSQQSSQ